MWRGGALTALLVLACTPALAHANPALFGFSDNAVVRGDLSPTTDSQLLAGGGANLVRVTVDWSSVEREPGRLNFSVYDAAYRSWLSRGIRPLMIVAYAPRWARPANLACATTDACHAPPDVLHDSSWSHFVSAVAHRYPAAAGIEVWNEPNLGAAFEPAPDPARYTQLLSLAAKAVHSAAPGMPVLSGGLADDLSRHQNSSAWGVRPFLRAMYAHGARGMMDGLSVHAYPRDRGEGKVYAVIDSVLEEQGDAGDTAPIWLTEVGWSTGRDSTSTPMRTGGLLGIWIGGDGVVSTPRETQQAILLGDLVQRLARRPALAAFSVHTLTDPRGSVGGGYGLIRANGGQKPAYCAVARARGVVTSCSAPSTPSGQLAEWNAEERVQAAAETAIARHRVAGTYRGLTLPSGSGVDATDVPNGVDGTQLCDRLLQTKRYCLTLVHDGSWSFTVRDSNGNVSSW